MSNIKKDVTTRDPNPPYADDLNALFYQHRGQIAGNSNLGPLDPGDIASGNGGKKETSVNWSGYAVETNLASPEEYAFTDVKGSWIVPSVSSDFKQSAYSAIWIGFDGYSSKTVEQIGTEQDYIKGVPVYYAWYEMYPKQFVKLDLSISAGNSISAEVKYVGNETYELTLNNLTTNETFSIPVQSKKPIRSSAEWIVEGTKQLAVFNTVEFTGASATANGHTGTISDSAWQNDSITMVSKKGDVNAEPTPLVDDGSSFSIKYEANNNTGGTSAVSDGAHAANMALLVQYIASSFVPSAAGFGTLVHNPALEPPTQMLTQPHHG